MDSAMKNQPLAPVVRRNAWKKVLSTAGVFYVILLLALLLTRNSNIFPSLMMVGSFMVPVAYVAFFS
jgi:protease PrsW